MKSNTSAREKGSDPAAERAAEKPGRIACFMIDTAGRHGAFHKHLVLKALGICPWEGLPGRMKPLVRLGLT
jgi:hypothetical protein